MLKVFYSENVSDPIDDLLKRLEEVLDKTIAEAHDLLNKTELAVNQTAAQVEVVTRNALNETKKKFQDEVNELKARAKAAGVNADECFGADETTLINLPEVTAHEMSQCTEGCVLKIIQVNEDLLVKVSIKIPDYSVIFFNLK